MDFTVHSHWLDIAKHCAPLHIIVEHFHFMTVAERGGEKDGNTHDNGALYCLWYSLLSESYPPYGK